MMCSGATHVTLIQNTNTERCVDAPALRTQGCILEGTEGKVPVPN